MAQTATTARTTTTADIGPGLQATAQVLNNVDKLTIDVVRSVYTVQQSSPSKITDYDFAEAATITATISAGVLSVTVS